MVKIREDRSGIPNIRLTGVPGKEHRENKEEEII